MTSSFTGKTVVVTGGTGGLGSAIVAAFAAAGARVVVADLAEREAGWTASDGIRFVPLDVSDEESWIRLFDAVEAGWSVPDVLVNNAGIYRPNIPFEEMPLGVWRQHFAVNSDGVFLGCKHAILRMKGRGGSIVNMGSGMSIKANPLGAAYCGSKAAVLMTTRTAAASAGRYGIRVNAVLPGAVPTDMLMGNLNDGEDGTAYTEKLAALSPLGKLATAEDIARAVLFLASPKSGAITGVYLPVDGGNMPGA